MTSADAIADRAVRHSVLRIGLLPERTWGNSEHDGVDVSGLGAPEGQMTPHGVADWEESGTDTMRLVRRRQPIDADNNRPVLDGQPVDALAHRDAILRGFRSAYSMLAGRRHVLLAPDGPLQQFAQDPVAVFLRSSRTYRRLLRESYHPDVLRDALDRDRLFDLLWMEVPGDKDLIGVIRSERDDLWNGDIPRFTARPGARDLWFGAGERLADFFPEPSLSTVQRIVDRMGAADCDRQAWFIEASLASLPGSLRHWPSYPATRSVSSVDSDRLLAAAVAVGNRLEELAIRGRGDASWIGLELTGRRVWSVARSGMDLAAGIPGITLFLAYLGAVTGREAASSVAAAALTTMRRSIAEGGRSLTGIGGFDGVGGVIYVLSHLATLWARPDLAQEADALASRVSDQINEDDDFDIFGGAAGCILALRSLQQCLPSDRVTALAVRCGDHLLDSAQRTTPGIGWAAISSDPARRCGLAFGTAGIALALLELHAWTGIDRFRAAGLEAIDGDRGRPASTADDDGRAAHGGASWTAWCQGTGGIDLVRLCCSSEAIRGAVDRADIVVVAEAIRDGGFGRNHSLGHGDFGSLELLARAAVALEDHGWSQEVARMAATIVDDIERHGWRCGTPLGVETPGLLAGLCGIGYGLLRTARPDLVPSVLTLEAPLPSRRAHGG